MTNMTAGELSTWINDFRVFPRLVLCWLLWIGADAYLWAKAVIAVSDVATFTNAIIGAVVLGLFAYMGTGGTKK